MKLSSFYKVAGYNGDYRISKQGFLISRKTGKWRKLRGDVDHYGYKRVALTAPNGTVRVRFVHRIVLETFVGPCPANMICRHLDGDSLNNSVDNLKWGTYQENADDSLRHGTRLVGVQRWNARLTSKKVRWIRSVYEWGLYNLSQLARRFKVSVQTIWNVVHNFTWTHV